MAPLIVHSAHQPGFSTCLAFSHDGLTIHTGGEDALVRKWPLDLDSGKEPELADEANEAVTSLATSRTCWLSASLDSCVRKYDANEIIMEGLVTRAVAVPVRCVAIDPKGERVAVASDELEVKIVNLNDTTNIRKLEGHRRGVRKATWHPSGTFLTTCGSEGDIIVWDVSPGGEPERMETITGIIPVADPESSEFAHDCSAVWHPSGRYFVAASRTHEIVMVSRDTWQKTLTFSDDNITGAITALAISPNGVYLASASQCGILVWSTTTRKVLFRHVLDSAPAMVLQLAFSPTQNLLAWTDAEGNLLRWPEPIPDSSPDPVKAHTMSSSTGVPLRKKRDPLLFDDGGDARGDETLDVAAIDNDYGVDDDWMIDDIGLLDKARKEKDPEEMEFMREMVSVTKAQPAFQPASTPMINKKRYLAYNMIGVIEATDRDTHHIINVEFHDRSTRAASHFQDTLKFDMASLGACERGALYACSPEGEHPAQVMYKPYSGWASSGEWQYSLPAGEKVIALAAGGTLPSKSLRHQSFEADLDGNGNVIVATSYGHLRFFSGGGLQRYLWSLGADVVSMVAGREWVFVVHRDGGTSLDGCQNLSYMLIAWDTFDIVQRGKLPLPRGTTLKWIGIAEEGAPTMYDSAGLLSILDRFRRPGQARWAPILDTMTLARRKGKDESYWPVGVSGVHFMCLILKGREEYPGFPRPLIQELQVQMPLFSLDVPQGQMEERFLREELQIGMLRDALGFDLTNEEISRREFGLDKELIQQIQLACKVDKLQRALDAAALLHNISSFDMAIKVAEFYHLIGLQEKLTILKLSREENDRLEEERERRKKLLKQSAPIVAPLPNADQSSRRQIEEFAPRSTTIRKSLAPAVPVTGGTRRSGGGECPLFEQEFKDSTLPSSVPPSDISPNPWEHPLDADPTMFETDVAFSSAGDGKRKRADTRTMDNDYTETSSASKRRALSDDIPFETTVGKSSDKSSNNPFARKPQDTKNPFSRPARSKANTATKSNSFFDKVDEVNEVATQGKTTAGKPRGKANGKGKEKEDGSRQMTLFGLPLVSPQEKQGRCKPPKDNEEPINPTRTQRPNPSVRMAGIPTLESNVAEAMAETQSTGGPVNEPGGSQGLDSRSPDNDPVQVIGKPEIDWPPSPPRRTGTESAAEVIVN